MSSLNWTQHLSANASVKLMLMPAPRDAAMHVRKTSKPLFCERGCCNYWARVDTEPSIAFR